MASISELIRKEEERRQQENLPELLLDEDLPEDVQERVLKIIPPKSTETKKK